MSELLYIVDTFSLVFQTFHAIPPMTGPKGQPTNAVFGFTRDVKAIIDDKQPTHLICAMDSSGPAERTEIYADYKAHRPAMPEDLTPQIPLIYEVLAGFRIPVVEHAGWEADDVIATVVRMAVERGMQVRIVTGDKDARQLIGPQVKVYNCRKNHEFGEEELLAEWGVRPDQVIDFQSLVGDSVDNVPGVPLVGPKKAQALLEKFGTLEEVLAHADEAPGKKLRENLKNYADQALMSRELVTLKPDLPLEVDWDAARIGPPDKDGLVQAFRDLGFRRLSEEMEQLRLEADEAEIEQRDSEWEIVDTPEQLARLVSQLEQQEEFSVVLVTQRGEGLDPAIVGWAFSRQPHSGSYVPIHGPNGQRVLSADSVTEALSAVIKNPRVTKHAADIKTQMTLMRGVGTQLSGIGVDPVVGDYLIDAGGRGHGLIDLSRRFLKRQIASLDDLLGTGKQRQGIGEVDVARVAEFACERADVALQLADAVAADLKEQGLWQLYWELERPLSAVIADMEHTGIRVDAGELKRQSDELALRLDALIAEIHALAGREFNIGSPKQLAEVLFDDLNLPVLKRTKTGASTNQDVLERLAVHPDLPVEQRALPAKLIEHRHLSKLKGTYLDALPALIHPGSGRIHTSFNQVGAATGRLSSNDPNLQNIPIRTPEGSRVRRAFVAGEADSVLVCADYSQIELRILAHFSNDAALKEAFARGEDIHTAVASQVFFIDPRDVTAEQRRIAKAVNFGIAYGQTPWGLSAALGIPKDEAAAFIDAYFERYAGVERFIHRTLAEVKRTRFARTILGRRREITGIRKTDGRMRNMPERTAVNTVIQGSAADLIKRAMIDVHAGLTEHRLTARLLLQIHDELVFESPQDEVDALVTMARERMEQALKLSVPLVVDVKVGPNWLDAEPWQPQTGSKQLQFFES